jgi:hypothetical protein
VRGVVSASNVECRIQRAKGERNVLKKSSLQGKECVVMGNKTKSRPDKASELVFEGSKERASGASCKVRRAPSSRMQGSPCPLSIIGGSWPSRKGDSLLFGGAVAWPVRNARWPVTPVSTWLVAEEPPVVLPVSDFSCCSHQLFAPT